MTYSFPNLLNNLLIVYVLTKLIADISDFHTESNNSSFHGPNEIQPGQQVECSIKIKSNKITTMDSFNMDDIPSSKDRLQGDIRWKTN